MKKIDLLSSTMLNKFNFTNLIIHSVQFSIRIMHSENNFSSISLPLSLRSVAVENFTGYIDAIKINNGGSFISFNTVKKITLKLQVKYLYQFLNINLILKKQFFLI